MAYVPTSWINNNEPAITAEKLNKIEFGISSAHGIAEGRPTEGYVNDQIAIETQARIDYVNAQVNNLEVQTQDKLDTINSTITTLENEVDATNSSIIPTIENEFGDPTSNIYASTQQISVAAADDTWSLTTLKTNLEATFGDNASNIYDTLAVYTTDEEAAAISKTVLEAEVADTESPSYASITQNALAAANTEWSLNTLTTNLAATFGENASNIDTAITNSVDNNYSLSTVLTNLTSEFGENASNITSKLSTYATNEDVGAIAQVQLDVDGRITGWTAVDSSVGGSAFKITADTFSIADATNEHTPFSIDANGELNINAKVNISNNPTLALTDMSNVTTIDGGKITTNTALVNNLNATGGIVADEITANEITGKKITGAIIEGAVLKGCYLDLNQGLKLLTDYHISVATYNANPSNYIDAVYEEDGNDYRIPTLTQVHEDTVSSNMLNNGDLLTGKVCAYNIANVEHNLKAKLTQPVWVTSTNFELINFNAIYGKKDDVYSIDIIDIRNLMIAKFGVYLSGTNVGTFSISTNSSYVTFSFTSNYATNVSRSYPFMGGYETFQPDGTYKSDDVYTFSIPIFNLSIFIEYIYDQSSNEANMGMQCYASFKMIVTAQANSSKIPFDWNNSQNLTVKRENTTPSTSNASLTYTSAVSSLNSGLYVDNLQV